MHLSAIDRLPVAVRELISDQRAGGARIREIHESLAALGVHVSFSSLGRHTQKLDRARPLAVGEELAALRVAIAEMSKHLRRVQRLLERR